MHTHQTPPGCSLLGRTRPRRRPSGGFRPHAGTHTCTHDTGDPRTYYMSKKARARARCTFTAVSHASTLVAAAPAASRPAVARSTAASRRPADRAPTARRRRRAALSAARGRAGGPKKSQFSPDDVQMTDTHMRVLLALTKILRLAGASESHRHPSIGTGLIANRSPHSSTRCQQTSSANPRKHAARCSPHATCAPQPRWYDRPTSRRRSAASAGAAGRCAAPAKPLR